jgi:predicted  nucleic acid-binding Zn-ribbon protein
MKREFLEGLGLEKEVVDKIMTVNGTDIENQKDETTKAENKLSDIRIQLKTANTTITDLKKSNGDNETLQTTIKDHEATIEKLKNDASAKEFDLALELELVKSKTRNTKALKAVLDLEKIKQKDDGSFEGLEDQLKEKMEKESYLFETGANQTIFKPKGGEGGSGINPFAKDTFNLTEQGKLYKENPAQAKELAIAAGVKI